MNEHSIEPSFVKKDQFSNEFDVKVKKYLSTPVFEVRSTISPEHITECSRRIFYRCTGTKPEKVINTNSSMIKRKVSRSGSLFSAGIKVVKARSSDSEENIVVSDYNYNIVGELDCVITINEKLLATKIYSVDKETFEDIKTRGASRKNVIAIMVYMWMIELNDGLLVYENSDDYTCESFHITPHKPIIKSVVQKCKKISDSIMGGTIPDRSYDEKTSIECGSCEFLLKCWGKQGD